MNSLKLPLEAIHFVQKHIQLIRVGRLKLVVNLAQALVNGVGFAKHRPQLFADGACGVDLKFLRQIG